jgi:antitoxin component of RelBE/YafQ-DinJ toxin-antitoxin module
MSVTAPKNERLSIRINSKLKKQVLKYCRVHDVEISKLVTQLLKQALAEEQQEKSVLSA